MDDLPKILLGILIGALIVGGAVMFFSHSGDNPMNETNDSVSEVAQEQVNTVNNGGNNGSPVDISIFLRLTPVPLKETKME